ncbi:MAG: hypothetical protein JSV44_12125 [Candidatus Zixiibacteriota bacterium]|nr:MAG: hypothetical protein JSV44_12125 [candidate division Zixibacteria bacterium]
MKKKFTLKSTALATENADACPADGAPVWEKADSEINLYDLIRLLLRHKKLIICTTVVVIILVSAKTYLTPSLYISQASILPSGRIAKMAQLRSLTGIGDPVIDDENSSDLFPVILHSQYIRNAILDKAYSFQSGDQIKTVTCQEYFGHYNPDILRQRLAGATYVAMDHTTGVIELAVETEYPALSQAILRQYIIELENFNLHKRRSRARENERYLAGQLALQEVELENAEDSLEVFQKANRNWDASADPEILKTLGRLKRDIQIKAETYIFLREQHESAKLNAQKDVPVVRILDEPSLPILKSGPRRKLTILMAGIATFMVMVLFILIIDIIRKRIRKADRQSIQNLRRDFIYAFPRSARAVDRVTQALHK